MLYSLFSHFVLFEIQHYTVKYQDFYIKMFSTWLISLFIQYLFLLFKLLFSNQEEIATLVQFCLLYPSLLNRSVEFCVACFKLCYPTTICIVYAAMLITKNIEKKLHNGYKKTAGHWVVCPSKSLLSGVDFRAVWLLNYGCLYSQSGLF